MKDNLYYTQSDLPPLPIATEDQKDFIARRPRETDLLGKNILLIFDQAKMAVQCLKPQKLLLDNLELSCTSKANNTHLKKRHADIGIVI